MLKSFLHTLLLPTFVLLVGLAGTYYWWSVENNNVNIEFEREFELKLEEVELLLENKNLEYQELLLGLRGLFAASTVVDRNEFVAYVESLELAGWLPSVRAVAFVRTVFDEDVESFIEDVRNDTSVNPDGYPNFDIFPLNSNDIHYVGDYIVPFKGNETAFGFDLSSDTSRRIAIEYALENNTFGVTEPVKLVLNEKDVSGFIMILPVYQNKVLVNTSEQRAEANVGFLLGVLKTDDLFRASIQNRFPDIHFEVVDVTEEEVLLYKSKNEVHEYLGSAVVTIPLQLSNRTWNIRAQPSKAFSIDETLASTPKNAATSGVVASILLFAFFLAITNSRRSALALVEKRTKELAQVNEYQEAILNSSAYSIISTDLNGIISSFNKGAEEMLGYSSKELVGIKDPGILHDPKEVVQHAKDLTKELGREIKPGFEVFVAKAKLGQFEEKKWTYIAKNGNRIPVLLSVTALRNKDNVITGFLGVAQNISAQIEAEKSLENFKLAVESSTDGIMLTTPDAEIVYVNRAWQKKTGYSMKEVSGKNANITQSGKTPESVYTQMWKNISKGKEFVTEEIINKTKDGREYPVHLAIYPLKRNSKIEYFVGVEQDITERKAVDKAKTEFVSLASHQLRTPLSAINWFAQMLEAGDAGKLNKEQKLYAKQILDANKRMVALVDSLLNVSRVDLGTFAIEPKKLKLSKIAESVLVDLTPSIKAKKHKIKKRFDKDIPELMVDEKLTRIIFQNYLSNAVKYSPEKSTITVGINKVGKFVQISVKDTGYGIPKSQESRIFEKLFRADNVREMETDGTGLGLYIIKAITEAVGGKAWFETVEKKGSTFYATIPLSGMKKKKGNKELS